MRGCAWCRPNQLACDRCGPFWFGWILYALMLLLLTSCAFTYREATAPTDHQMMVRYSAPAAGLGIVLNAAKVPWWGRLATYVPVWVQCRYGRALQVGEWCHRPESVGINLAVGYFAAEFVYFIGRRRIR